jgi:hypothetical protein
LEQLGEMAAVLVDIFEGSDEGRSSASGFGRFYKSPPNRAKTAPPRSVLVLNGAACVRNEDVALAVDGSDNLRMRRITLDL